MLRAHCESFEIHGCHNNQIYVVLTLCFKLAIVTGDETSSSSDAAVDSTSWLGGRVLGFPIDFANVLKHLKQDMRDDWYYDSLFYNDLFSNPHEVQKIILKSLYEWNGIYTGDTRYVRDIPKKGLGERYSLETDFFDRFVYQAICSFLMPFYDPLLSHRVLSYRYNDLGNKKYLFKNKIDKWFTFEGVTSTFLGESKHLVISDISNFFENVSVSSICKSLLNRIPNIIDATGPQKLQIRNAISTLDVLLKRWSFNKQFGLPQNRDASSFFSNVLLGDIDKHMEEAGYDYYRYVDDIRIICGDEPASKKAIQELIRQLRLVGMNINAAKTKILSDKAPKEEILECFPSLESKTTAINNMWRSRSRRVVSRSIKYIVQILNQCIIHNDTQSRQFRFAVNRLAIIVDTGLLDSSAQFVDRLIDLLIESLPTNPASTDQYCKLLSILDPDGASSEKLQRFLILKKESIYDWQNYSIWLLLASRKYTSAELVELAKTKLAEKIDTGEAAGIILWLRCTNNKSLLLEVRDKYTKQWPYQNQRYFLLSTDIFSPDELKPLYGKVGTKLMGTKNRAISYYPPSEIPIAEREKLTLNQVYDRITEYE